MRIMNRMDVQNECCTNSIHQTKARNDVKSMHRECFESSKKSKLGEVSGNDKKQSDKVLH